MNNLNYDDNTITIFNSFKDRFINCIKEYKKNTNDNNISQEITNVFNDIDSNFFDYYLRTQISELTNKEIKPLRNNENEILLFLTLEISKRYFNNENLDEIEESLLYFNSEQYFPPSDTVKEVLSYVKDLQTLVPDIKFISGKSAYEGLLKDYDVQHLNRLNLKNIDPIKDFVAYHQTDHISSKSLSWRNIIDINKKEDHTKIFPKIIAYSQLNFNQRPIFSDHSNIFFLDKYFEKNHSIYKEECIKSNGCDRINFSTIKDPDTRKKIVETIELALIKEYEDLMPKIASFLDSMNSENTTNSSDHPLYRIFYKFFFKSYYHEINNFLTQETPKIDFSTINETESEIKNIFNQLISTERQNILSKNSQEEVIEYLIDKINESPYLSSKLDHIFNKFPITSLIKTPQKLDTILKYWNKLFIPSNQFSYLLNALKKLCEQVLDKDEKNKLLEKFNKMLDCSNAHEYVTIKNNTFTPIPQYNLLFLKEIYPSFVSTLIDQLYDSLKSINFSEETPYSLINLLSVFKVLPSLKSSSFLVASTEKDSMFQGFTSTNLFNPEFLKDYYKTLTPEVYQKCKLFFEKLSEIMNSTIFKQWVENCFKEHIQGEFQKVAKENLPKLPEMQMEAFFDNVKLKNVGESPLSISINETVQQFIDKFKNLDKEILIPSLLSIFNKKISDYNSNYELFNEAFNTLHQKIIKLFGKRGYINDAMIGKFISPEGVLVDLLEKLFNCNLGEKTELKDHEYRLLRYVEPSDYDFVNRITDIKTATLHDITKVIRNNLQKEFASKLKVISLKNTDEEQEEKPKEVNLNKTAIKIWDFYHSNEWIEEYFKHISIDPIEGIGAPIDAFFDLFMEDSANNNAFFDAHIALKDFLEKSYNAYAKDFVNDQSKTNDIFIAEICKQIILNLIPSFKHSQLKLPTEEMLMLSLLEDNYSESDFNKKSIPKYFNYIVNMLNSKSKTPYQCILSILTHANMPKTKGLEALYFSYLSHMKETKVLYDEFIGDFFDTINRNSDSKNISTFLEKIFNSLQNDFGKKIVTDLMHAYAGREVSLENYSDSELDKWENSKSEFINFIKVFQEHAEEMYSVCNINTTFSFTQRKKDQLILSHLLVLLDSKLPPHILNTLSDEIKTIIEASKAFLEFEALTSQNLDHGLSNYLFKFQFKKLLKEINPNVSSTYLLDFEKCDDALAYWTASLDLLKKFISNSNRLASDSMTRFAHSLGINKDFTVEGFKEEIITCFNQRIKSKFKKTQSLKQFSDLKVYKEKMANIIKTENAASVKIDLIKNKNILNAYRKWIEENCFNDLRLDIPTKSIILDYFQDFAKNDCYTKAQIQKLQSKITLNDFHDHVKIKLHLLSELFELFGGKLPYQPTELKEINFRVTTRDKKYILVGGCEKTDQLLLRGHIGFLPDWELTIKNQTLHRLQSMYLLHPKVAKMKLSDDLRIGAYKIHNVVQPVHIGEEAVTTALENVVRINLAILVKSVLTKAINPKAAFKQILELLLNNLKRMDDEKVKDIALKDYKSVIGSKTKEEYNLVVKQTLEKIQSAKKEYIDQINELLKGIEQKRDHIDQSSNAQESSVTPTSQNRIFIDPTTQPESRPQPSIQASTPQVNSLPQPSPQRPVQAQNLQARSPQPTSTSQRTPQTTNQEINPQTNSSTPSQSTGQQRQSPRQQNNRGVNSPRGSASPRQPWSSNANSNHQSNPNSNGNRNSQNRGRGRGNK